MLINREDIRPVQLPEEQLPVPEIGGTVLVRGMDMPRFIKFEAARRRFLEPLEGESAEDAAQRAGAELLPVALHLCVLASDGQPIYTAAEWAAFAVRHGQRVGELWQAVERLNGLGDAKNG